MNRDLTALLCGIVAAAMLAAGLLLGTPTALAAVALALPTLCGLSRGFQPRRCV